jgi:hypothetical protein
MHIQKTIYAFVAYDVVLPRLYLNVLLVMPPGHRRYDFLQTLSLSQQVSAGGSGSRSQIPDRFGCPGCGVTAAGVGSDPQGADQMDRRPLPSIMDYDPGVPDARISPK